MKLGKRRQSCDRCFQFKQSCDAAITCARCRSSGITCTYRRLDGYTAFSSPSNFSGIGSNLAVNDSITGGLGSGSERMHLQFLLNFTDPCTFGTFTAVNIDHSLRTSLQHAIGYSSLESDEENSAMMSGMSIWDQGDGLLDLVDIFLPGIDEESHSATDYPVLEPTEECGLQDRMGEIISQLSNIHNSISRGHALEQESFNIRLAESVFTVTNLKHFVRAFFSGFYRYLPIIHRPTFDSEHISLPLLLAVFLIGSVHSAPKDPAISARSFLDLAEEHIFNHYAFWGLLEVDRGGEVSVEEIEILQAAIIILAIQISKDDVTTQRRIRLER